MKKEQLPENIRSLCPDGLTEEQVEAWLLGYWAGDASSNDKTDLKAENTEKPDNKQPLRHDTDVSIERELGQGEQFDGALDLKKKTIAEIRALITTWDSDVPGWALLRNDSRVGVRKLAKHQPQEPDGKARECDDSRTAEGEEQPTKDPVVYAALVVGLLSTFLFQVGILPLIGLGLTGWAFIRSRKNSGKDRGKVVGATCLNILFFLVHVGHRGHMAEGEAVFLGIILSLGAGLVVFLDLEHKNSSIW